MEILTPMEFTRQVNFILKNKAKEGRVIKRLGQLSDNMTEKTGLKKHFADFIKRTSITDLFTQDGNPYARSVSKTFEAYI